MIALIEKEVVGKKKWITGEKMLDIIAVAESTPGPISINTATFIGTERAGVFGALVATVGVVLPSFAIIFALSLFIEKFKSLTYVGYAFKGIRVAVLVIILTAVFRLMGDVEKTVFSVLTAVFTLVMCIFTGLHVIFTLLICAGAGIIYGFIVRMIRRKRGDKKK